MTISNIAKKYSLTISFVFILFYSLYPIYSEAKNNDLSIALKKITSIDGFQRSGLPLKNDDCSNGLSRGVMHYSYDNLGKSGVQYYIIEKCKYRTIFIDKESIVIADDSSDVLGLEQEFLIISLSNSNINNILSEIGLSDYIFFPKKLSFYYNYTINNVYAGISETDSGAGIMIDLQYYDLSSLYASSLNEFEENKLLSSLKYLFNTNDKKNNGYIATIRTRRYL
ncbi:MULTISPECIES: hypothetical protein [Vibrio]|uniref:Uncharacterized protein n=1 Tax=Vibrio ezurae NBRC 102218 TaxID=1219080 RepID=U3AZK2_9VIBR|nr:MULTISPECIES: hypothetical protein [Vibrio]MPW34873.1 hypothetical protein [Vibrio sp. B1Z05]GAD78642.1 hypothetical protein VEZ01S_05_00300 [Vibrio ezurae NBRC 102218]